MLPAISCSSSTLYIHIKLGCKLIKLVLYYYYTTLLLASFLPWFIFSIRYDVIRRDETATARVELVCRKLQLHLSFGRTLYQQTIDWVEWKLIYEKHLFYQTFLASSVVWSFFGSSKRCPSERHCVCVCFFLSGCYTNMPTNKKKVRKRASYLFSRYSTLNTNTSKNT